MDFKHFNEAQVLSAMDLPLDAVEQWQVGRCRICTTLLTDCGLVWGAEYPSSPQEETSRRNPKRKKKQRPATSPTEHRDDVDVLLASQLEQLGLPAGFGSSKGQIGEAVETGLECATEEEVTAGATSSYADPCLYPASKFDLNDTAQQQGGYCDWQQAYDDTYGCFYYYCERTQETRWEPPAVGYLPIPLEWLPTHMQDSYAATQMDTPWQQQAQSVPACQNIKHLDKQLSQHGSATPLSDCTEQEAIEPQHSHAIPYARNASQIHAEVEKQHSKRSSFPIRPESSGLMSSIPQPQGTHLRFDNPQQGCVQEPTAVLASHTLFPADQTASTGSPRSLDATAANGEHCSSAHHIDRVHPTDVSGEVCSAAVAQQAAHSILSSTVMTDEPLQQAAELSNIIPDGPTSTPDALQEMADTCCEALLPINTHTEQNEAQQDVAKHKAVATMPAADDDQNYMEDAQGNSTEIDADDPSNKLACEADEKAPEAEGPGIVFQSLSNQLQSKRELPRKLWKYWLQRYSLFQKFDEGILMDEEGWYSATPEVIAAHQAERCRCSVVVDAFAGVGGNAIQFALTCDQVIAVELSAQRLEIAKHNAEVYGVAHKIQFICGDFLKVASSLQADVVFLSPPWGGPAYNKSGLFDVAQSIGSLGQNLSQLVETASTALRHPESQRIACFLPRNTSLLALSDSSNTDECLVERNILNGHFKAVTAYFGDLASAHGA